MVGLDGSLLKVAALWGLATGVGWAGGAAAATAARLDEACWTVVASGEWTIFFAAWAGCGALAGALAALGQGLVSYRRDTGGLMRWISLSCLGTALGWSAGAGLAAVINERLLWRIEIPVLLTARMQGELLNWALTTNFILVACLVLGGATASLGQAPLVAQRVGWQKTCWWAAASCLGAVAAAVTAVLMVTVLAELSPWLAAPFLARGIGGALPEQPRFIVVASIGIALAAAGAMTGMLLGQVLLFLMPKATRRG